MKIFIQTYGCTLNQSDSELMSGLLELAGHEIVADGKTADLIIFNTCTVKDSPEKSFYHALEKLSGLGKKIIVAGCVSQSDPGNKKLSQVSLVGVRQLEHIADVVSVVQEGRVVKLLDFKKNNRLNLPKIRKNPVVEIIPISAGCLGDCTFCKTRFARGTLFSYDPDEIKRQMQNAIKDGVKEVWLTSQDAGAYGKDIGSDLITLLDELLKIPGEHKIRLGMINPDHAKEMLPGLIKILNHERMFKFIHLPVQSGSNSVLKNMRRKYSVEDFNRVVVALRKGVSDLTVATDLIIGFPGESEEDHEASKKLIAEMKFPIINMTKFYPRSGTLASKMKLHPTKLVKKRSSELVSLQKKLIDNKEWLGWVGDIVIDEIGKNGESIGRNSSYVQIVLKIKRMALGSVVKVRVVGVHQYYLECELA
jgi:threonylcarbamoyladenosine tRNA methylthiotransferase CDKAL1